MCFVGMLHVSDDKRIIKIFIQINLLCSETRHKSKSAEQIHVASSEKKCNRLAALSNGNILKYFPSSGAQNVSIWTAACPRTNTIHYS